MIGKIVKVSDFETKVFISELQKNHTQKKIKINTYKKSFSEVIADLYKKIFILNKYRKIKQNIISFGCSFNISNKKNINIPFFIPEKFNISDIKLYFICDKFQFNKIKTSEITKNISTGLNENFYFNSDAFTKKISENTDSQYLFLSKKKISGSVEKSGIGSGQSYGANKYIAAQSSDFIIKYLDGSLWPENGKTLFEEYSELGEIEKPNEFHTHLYTYAPEDHKHYLQPTAHLHSYQIEGHNHKYPEHSHKFTTPEHSHDVNFSHSHDIENEFSQSENIGNITIKINNNIIINRKINGEIEFSQYIKKGLNTINLSCSDKCFFIYTITAIGDIKIE